MTVTYDFRCDRGETFERRYPMGEAPSVVTCEDHGTPAKRQLPRVTIPAFPGSHKATYRSKGA